jgi:hypothetical protein
MNPHPTLSAVGAASPSPLRDASLRPLDQRTLGDLRRREPCRFDLGAVEAAAAALLNAMGVDLTDEALSETPHRLAAAYSEMLTPQPFDATTFPKEPAYDDLVVACSIPFHSLCEHHPVPFQGLAPCRLRRPARVPFWRLNTAACRSAGWPSPAPRRSPPRFAVHCATTPAHDKSSSH